MDSGLARATCRLRKELEVQRKTRLYTCLIVLMMAWSASANVVKVVAIDNTDAEAAAMGLTVYDLYVEFDDPDDHLFLMGTDLSYIWTDDPNGFYQHPLGEDTAPSQAIIGVFPELAYDSFVTIGVLTDDGTDGTVLGDFDSEAFNHNGEILGTWYNPFSQNGQGDPDANSLVVMAQVTVTEGHKVWGDVWIYYNEAVPVRRLFAAGCTYQPPADFNGDGWVTGSELVHILVNWGPCPGCDADLDGDGSVGASDLSQLLAVWGPCN